MKWAKDISESTWFKMKSTRNEYYYVKYLRVIKDDGIANWTYAPV